MPTRLHAYSSLLHTLYAATCDEAQWPNFLHQFCEATDSLVAFLVQNDSVYGQRALAVGGCFTAAQLRIPPPEERTYSDPVRKAFLRMPRTGVVEVEDFLPHSSLTQTELYQQSMAPAGIAYGTCIVPALSPRRYELLALWRGGDRPRLSPDHRSLIDLLYPHICNALRIREALVDARELAANAQNMLDASTTACLLLSASGHAVHMNAAARNLARASDGITLQQNRVLPTDRRVAVRFTRLVAESAADACGAASSLLIDRRGSKRPLQAIISPFHSAPSRELAGRVLVLLTDPDQSSSFPDAILRELYRLTPAEIELANGIMTGYSVREVAAVRAVAVGTVRSQLKSVMAKTATSRQADLVRLLSTLPRSTQKPGLTRQAYPI